MDEITINDGKGLYDSDGLIDSLIVDCNDAVKELISGQYIQFCTVILNMAQKLVELKKGLKADIESKNRTIGELKQINDELVAIANGIPAEKEGD